MDNDIYGGVTTSSIPSSMMGRSMSISDQMEAYYAARQMAMHGQTVAVKPDPAVVVDHLRVRKLDNGLLMTVRVGTVDATREIYVETIEELGNALVAAIVAARMEK